MRIGRAEQLLSQSHVLRAKFFGSPKIIPAPAEYGLEERRRRAQARKGRTKGARMARNKKQKEMQDGRALRVVRRDHRGKGPVANWGDDAG